MKFSTFFIMILIVSVEVYWGYNAFMSTSYYWVLIGWALFYPIIFDLLGIIKHMEKPTTTIEIISGLKNRKQGNRENFYSAVFYISNIVACLAFAGCSWNIIFN